MTLQYAADGRLCNLTPELLGWDDMPERDELLAGECQPLRPAGAPASGADASQPMVQTHVTQTLWPTHCVQGTAEAGLHPDLAYDPEQHVLVQKGTSPHLDGYSALYDNGFFAVTAVPGLLRDSNITDVYGKLKPPRRWPGSCAARSCGCASRGRRPVARRVRERSPERRAEPILPNDAPPCSPPRRAVTGLALDYCVQYTATHSAEDGYRTHLVLDATRAVAPDTGDLALSIMRLLGVQVLNSSDLLAA